MDRLLAEMEKMSHRIGKTPLVKLQVANIQLAVKLEYANFTGSIKARAAYNILYNAIKHQKITSDTTVIESSSGNFAIALAALCRGLGLKFIAVIDPNITQLNEQRLHELAHNVIKVKKRDETGGFLLTRLQYIKDYIHHHKDVYWPNQYENPDNYMSYYHFLAPEIEAELPKLEFLFAAVSTGGTITGLSLRLKELYPDVKVIAVDVEGSVIFGSKPQKRELSGIGSSKVPPIIQHARIDEVMILSEVEIKKGARELLSIHGIFGGASCGAAYRAVTSYFYNRRFFKPPSVVFICPDHGASYQDSVYSEGTTTAAVKNVLS